MHFFYNILKLANDKQQNDFLSMFLNKNRWTLYTAICKLVGNNIHFSNLL